MNMNVMMRRAARLRPQMQQTQPMQRVRLAGVRMYSSSSSAGVSEGAAAASPSSPASSPASSRWSNRVGAVVFLGLATVTATLGVWQVQRKEWKEGLIKQRQAQLASAPVDLRTLLEQYGNDGRTIPEFQRVRVRGVLDYKRQAKLGPRAAPRSSAVAGSSMVAAGVGYHLVTPMRVEDTDILVNRGWADRVSADGVFPEVETPNTTNHEVEIIGVTRRAEAQPKYLGEHNPAASGSFIFMDVPRMAALLRLNTPYPVVVDVLEPTSTTGLVRKSDDQYIDFTTTPMIHSVYAATWFTLSALMVLTTYYRFGRGVGGGGRLGGGGLGGRARSPASAAASAQRSSP